MPENKEITAPGEYKLLYFKHLAAYACFLLEHRLEDFSMEVMRLMRETNLPLLAFFEDLSERQRKEIALQNTAEFLTYLSGNKPGELIELSVNKWLSGQLPVIEREVLGADEINAICYIRKKCFLTFLPFYTADLVENNRIITEIDEFTHRFELACHQVFKVLQQEALTSRRHMIKRIEHTEELYEQAQKITHIGNWVWHIDENRVIWSNELYRIYGLVPQSEEITFEKFISLVHPEDRERVTQQIQDTLQTSVPNDFYHRIVLADGTVKTLHARGEVLIDEQGKPYRMVGTGQDVSEQRQRERELKELNQHLEEKEQNFRHLIQNAPDAIIVIDEEGKILLWNVQAEKTFGWSAAQVEGSLLVDSIILQHQRDLFTEEIRMFFAGGGEGPGPSKIVELTTQNKAGTRVEVSLAISKTTQKGRPAFVAFLRDISDRKKAEAELNASRMQLEKLYAQLEQNYDELEKSYTELIRIRRQLADDRTRFLINTMPHMVASAAPDGMLDYANQRLMDFTGFTFDELKGWGWGRCIYHEDLDRLVQTWKNSLETGKAMQIEFRIQNAEGKPFWHLANVKPHRDEKGEITMWIASITNIHEHRMMEEKKDEFIGIASHELKTPLTSAKAYMQLLETQLRKTNDEESMLYVKKATTSIDRINDLISELLDISKIQHGKLPLIFKEFDFNEMMDETIELIQQTSRHKIIKTGLSGYLVTGDKERLRQVCVNLLTNAVKYSPKGDKVDVRITNDHDKLLVAVADYGIGIPKGEQEKIFERFYRVEGVGPQFQGLGIGLFITAEIVRRHKGKIWVKSEQGKGSTFYFTVPFKIE